MELSTAYAELNDRKIHWRLEMTLLLGARACILWH